MNDLQFGEFVVSPTSRQLRRADQTIALPSKTFDLLVYMVRNPGRVLSKDEILQSVWPNAFVEEANLTQNVFLLRKALGSGNDGPIVTIPGRGYQFTASVVELSPEPDGLSVVKPSLPDSLSSGRKVAGLSRTERLVYEEETEERIALWRSPLGGVFVAGVLAVFGIAAWLGWQRWQDHVGGPPVQVVMADFDGSTGDPVLDRTLKDILRFDLGQSPFVNVVSPGTSRSLMTLMQLKPTDTLTVDVARDICERTGSQAVLRGSLAHFGTHYVITEEAINCVDGTSLGTAKQEVTSTEDLPRGMDRLGATLRHELGESRRMIARFNRPLSSEHTGSLEALKDFSQAAYLSQSGRFAEAIQLLKQAVALDPQFAAAYFNLAAYSSDILDPSGARAYLQKAYDLRDFATEPARLAIVATYESDITGDLFESRRNYQNWIDLYPRSAPAWNGLANVYLQLGRYADAVDAAKHHLALFPNNATAYQSLASAQMGNRDFAGARKTCDVAMQHGFDVELIHDLLLSLGHLTQDDVLIAAQEKWTDDHPDSALLLARRAAFAVSGGRIRESQQLLARMDDAFKHQGVPKAGIRFHQIAARAYFEMGEPELAKNQLHLAPVDPNELDELIALVEAGQRDAAAAMLNAQLASHPQSTLLAKLTVPLLRGKLAIAEGKPAEAIAAMEPSRGFDGQGMDAYYLRGLACMEAGELPQSAIEFRGLLSHPELEPSAWQLPMAQLQLARILARQNNAAAAREAYTKFLALWDEADADQPVLLQARAERAKIRLGD